MVQVTADDEAPLESWIRATTREQRLVLRARIILAPATCIDCHSDHHKGLKDCSQCHTAQGWTPANFTHPQVGPHIGSGGGERRTLQCGDCHDRGFGSGSCSCHGGQRFLPGQPLPSGGD